MTRHTLAPVDATAYRAAVSQHAAGVAIVTSTADGRPVGMTVSSFASHSIAPPTVSCDLATSSRSLAAIRDHRRFVVHLLDERQEAVAVRFATPDLDRFDAPDWRWERGLPVLDGTMARFEAELITDVEVGDHAVVLGAVVDVEVAAVARPLIHQDRRFHGLG